MHLDEAMEQIAEIRERMASSQTFRGYRSVSTFFSGMVAVVTAVFQMVMAPTPRVFVMTWVGAAAVCLVVAMGEMMLRNGRVYCAVQRQLAVRAMELFVPSVVAGGLLTWVFLDFLPGDLGLLPGLWMVVFSLGLFASARLLPREVFGVAGFYLMAGVVTLIQAGHVFEPMFMGVTFMVGQMGLAGILYVRLERK